MREISLFSDSELSKPLNDELIFDPIPSGKVSSKIVYLTNNIKYPIKLDLKIEGSDLSIRSDIINVKPNQVESFEIVFSPKITRMKPIKGKIIINMEYVVT